MSGAIPAFPFHCRTPRILIAIWKSAAASWKSPKKVRTITSTNSRRNISASPYIRIASLAKSASPTRSNRKKSAPWDSRAKLRPGRSSRNSRAARQRARRCGNRAQIHAVLPIERELQRTHHFAGQINPRSDLLESGCARLIVDDEREKKLIGEMRDGFRAAAEDRALVAVNALQIVEEFRRIQAPRNAEADAVRKRAVGFKKDAAVIVPDALSTLGLSERCAGRASKKNQKHDAGDSVAPGTHEFDSAKNILLLARSGEKKRETAKCVKRFAPFGLFGFRRREKRKT